MRLAAIVLALAALCAIGCSGAATQPPPDGGALPDLASARDLGPSPDGSNADLAPLPQDDPWFCVPDGGTILAQAVDGGPDGGARFLVTTDHYDIVAEVDDSDRATELGRIAEASWAAFADYYGKTPQLAMDERLSVDLFATQQGWSDALAANNIPVPGAGGIYWTGTKTAYLFRQPTRYFTDMLFVHEMSHQFHFLSRTGNTTRPGWYIEGMAEYLSRHDWDGQCLRLGRLPLLTQEDYPAIAVADFTNSGLNLAALVDDLQPVERPVDLMVFRYFERAMNDAYHAQWAKFRDLVDTGADPLATFNTVVGDPATIGWAIPPWTAIEQEPMSVIFLEWTHVEPGVVDVRGPGVLSCSRFKASQPTFAATIARPPTGVYGGVLVRYDDNSNFVAWLVGEDGTVSAFRYTAGKADWSNVAKVPIPNDGLFHWSVEFAQQSTNLMLNGQLFTDGSGMAKVGVLAAFNGNPLRFSDITWK
jgi:hypothetical protein